MLNLTSDPRHFQIITLSGLLGSQYFYSDFGPTALIAVVTLASACAFQAIFLNIFTKAVRPDLRSGLITALSLTILLKSTALWFYPLAALIAISSKFLIRVDNKHIFNPANIAIVSLLLIFPQYSWISPGQWGTSVLLGFTLICMAFLVLRRIPRWDMGPMFLAIWAMFIFGRALWLGDALDIPIHNLKNGAILIFAFFMISDPKTIPDHIWGRFIFALATAGLGYILMFIFQIRAGLFFALAVMCVLRPFIDRVLTGHAYKWNGTTIQKG